jgi:hypothetical protein
MLQEACVSKLAEVGISIECFLRWMSRYLRKQYICFWDFAAGDSLHQLHCLVRLLIKPIMFSGYINEDLKPKKTLKPSLRKESLGF